MAVNLNDPQFKNTDPTKTDTPYARMMELTRAQDLRGKVTTLLGSDQFKTMGTGNDIAPGGEKWNVLHTLVGAVPHTARAQMLAEYPGLAQRLYGLEAAKRAGTGSTAASNSILQRLGS